MEILFAPIVQSSQPAFDYKTTEYKIYFKLSDYINPNMIETIGITFNEAISNLSLVNNGNYPNNVIYKPFEIMQKYNDYYYITIKTKENQDLNTNFKAETYYKIQIQCCLKKLENYEKKNRSGKIQWINKAIEAQQFSEWSTVMVLKAINPPRIGIIQNLNTINSYLVNIPTDIIVQQVESNDHPIFTCTYEIDENSSENLLEYKIQTKELNSDSLIEDSDWIRYVPTGSDSNKIMFNYISKKQLIDKKMYTTTLFIRSVNNYELSASYTYQLHLGTDGKGLLEDMKLIAKMDEENGIIELNLEYKPSTNFKFSETKTLFGNFIISRRNILTNIWEELTYINNKEWVFKKEEPQIIFKDFLVESGTSYEYQIQEEDFLRQRKKPAISNQIDCNFEYNFIYCNGIQLKLKYNSNIGTFKHSIQKQKIETIGGKYPTIIRNGYIYYAEIPIAGLISLLSDENEYFFQLDKEENYCYKGVPVIPHSRVYEEWTQTQYMDEHNKERPIADIYKQYKLSTDLTYDNIAMERAFREKVEEFLNVDITPKLLKTANQGSFIVDLININFKNRAELGDAIGEISGTAYEIAENNIANCEKYGITSIGEYQNVLTEEHFYEGTYSLNNGNNINAINAIIDSIGRSYVKDDTIIYYNEFQYFTDITIERGANGNIELFPLVKLHINDESIYIKSNTHLKFSNLTKTNTINSIYLDEDSEQNIVFIHYKAKVLRRKESYNATRDLATIDTFKQIKDDFTIHISDLIPGTNVIEILNAKTKKDLINALNIKTEQIHEKSGDESYNIIYYYDDTVKNARLEIGIKYKDIIFEGDKNIQLKVGNEIIYFGDTGILNFPDLLGITELYYIGSPVTINTIINYKINYTFSEIVNY